MRTLTANITIKDGDDVIRNTDFEVSVADTPNDKDSTIQVIKALRDKLLSYVSHQADFVLPKLLGVVEVTFAKEDADAETTEG